MNTIEKYKFTDDEINTLALYYIEYGKLSTAELIQHFYTLNYSECIDVVNYIEDMLNV